MRAQAASITGRRRRSSALPSAASQAAETSSIAASAMSGAVTADSAASKASAVAMRRAMWSVCAWLTECETSTAATISVSAAASRSLG